MAITINGSGTVTGLSVGGLPDGTVDAGTLATDSVVTGKIADGTIANADIADLAASKLTGALPAISGANITGLTSTQMPVGSVLQVIQTSSHNQTVSTTSTSYVASGIIATITPKYANSLILVSWNSSMTYSNGLFGGIIFVNIGGAGYNQMAGSSTYHMGYINSGNNYSPTHTDVQHQCTNTSTLNFQPYIKTSTGTAHLVHPGASYALTLTEIKQ
jgi:hypothetical protein